MKQITNACFYSCFCSGGRQLLYQIYKICICPALKVIIVIFLNICNMCPSSKAKDTVTQEEKQMKDNENSKWVFLPYLVAKITAAGSEQYTDNLKSKMITRIWA